LATMAVIQSYATEAITPMRSGPEKSKSQIHKPDGYSFSGLADKPVCAIAGVECRYAARGRAFIGQTHEFNNSSIDAVQARRCTSRLISSSSSAMASAATLIGS